MDWQLVFSTICTSIVAIYGLYKGIKEIKENSKSGREKRESKEKEEREERVQEIKDVVEPIVKVLEDKLDQHLEEEIEQNNRYNDDNAEARRIRILSYNDQLLSDLMPWPSESVFEQMMHDCDMYQKYCIEHPDFPNGIGESAIKSIRLKYDTVKDNKLFGKPKT